VGLKGTGVGIGVRRNRTIAVLKGQWREDKEWLSGGEFVFDELSHCVDVAEEGDVKF
jgi:hypothetical protein